MCETIEQASSYSSAGDGYFESFDYGESWTRPAEGLKHSYLNGLAVDSGNPEIAIVSASTSPRKAYSPENAESFVYRKDQDGKEWKPITDGLPEPDGSTIMNLASNQKVPGQFCVINNRGIFTSTDSGDSWSRVDIPWPREHLLTTPRAFAIV